jgi:hypothetical protein
LQVSFCICLMLSMALMTEVNPSNAKTGYSISVRVNNSSWEWSQTTETLSFRADSVVDGSGNSSKYLSVNGFAGNGLKENTYAKNGMFSSESTVYVKSLLNYVQIKESVDSSSTYYGVEINESIPTTVFSSDNFFYNGDGIYNSNTYIHGDNVIANNYHANKLLKTANYVGSNSKSLIFADVTPEWVNYRVLRNATAAFNLYSSSDKYSEFSYRRGCNMLEESYFGTFTLNKNLLYIEAFNLSNDQYQLGCLGAFED